MRRMIIIPSTDADRALLWEPHPEPGGDVASATSDPPPSTAARGSLRWWLRSARAVRHTDDLLGALGRHCAPPE
jgi:hypothetical protein